MRYNDSKITDYIIVQGIFMSQSIDRTSDNSYRSLLFDSLRITPVWMSKANCKNIDPREYEKVVQACDKCPVINNCQQWIDSHEIEKGVFAGKIIESK